MEITKKKKMREGSYVNTATWVEVNLESAQHRYKPEFTLQAATKTRGQSVEGKDEPLVWDIEPLPPDFRPQVWIHATKRFRILFAVS